LSSPETEDKSEEELDSEETELGEEMSTTETTGLVARMAVGRAAGETVFIGVIGRVLDDGGLRMMRKVMHLFGFANGCCLTGIQLLSSGANFLPFALLLSTYLRAKNLKLLQGREGQLFN
jgi:hypothetical protein